MIAVQLPNAVLSDFYENPEEEAAGPAAVSFLNLSDVRVCSESSLTE